MMEVSRGLVQQVFNVLIVKRIDDMPSIPTTFYQTEVPEKSEVVGNGCLPNAELFAEFGHGAGR